MFVFDFKHSIFDKDPLFSFQLQYRTLGLYTKHLYLDFMASRKWHGFSRHIIVTRHINYGEWESKGKH